MDAKEKIDIFNYTQNTVGQEEEGEGKEAENESDLVGKELEIDDDLDKEIELIDWRDVVCHTPTKPRAAKTMVGVSKPNNQHFRQRMQEAMAELEYDGDNIAEDEYDDDD